MIQDDAVQRGSNVRSKGSDIGRGTLALDKETYLSPAAIGFLAGLGEQEVKVYPRPSVTIIVTGSELQQPGQPLGPGQVYESNSYTLHAALYQLGIKDFRIFWVDDHLDEVVAALTKALSLSDVVLLTGGISVGDYDYVLQATALCGVTQLFHKVAQRPGKPLYFGIKGSQPVFGLPGNPSSVLTCFYEYVVPALEGLSRREALVKVLHLPLSKSIQKKEGLTYFIKGHSNTHSVAPLPAQESYRMSSFALANCLICLEAEGTSYPQGTLVEVHLLPI
jgi:molybdopterin molybdotransferase